MDELHVREAPRIRVTGDSGSRRDNLPDKLVRGRTYRDAGITAWLRGWLSRLS
jgi:hypothetical protein